MKYFIFLILGVGAGLAYIRLAPSDPARWHQATDLRDLGHVPQTGGHVYREQPENAQARFRAMDAVIRATPRTRVLAGTLDDGQITYVTRSRGFGFPDYTTLSLSDGGQVIEIRSRLRFGKSDLGVNRARIERWLEALGQG